MISRHFIKLKMKDNSSTQRFQWLKFFFCTYPPKMHYSFSNSSEIFGAICMNIFSFNVLNRSDNLFNLFNLLQNIHPILLVYATTFAWHVAFSSVLNYETRSCIYGASINPDSFIGWKTGRKKPFPHQLFGVHRKTTLQEKANFVQNPFRRKRKHVTVDSRARECLC